MADLREEIWQEVADWRAKTDAAAASAAMAFAAEAAGSLPGLAAATVVTAHQPLALRPLLALEGTAFITAAYHTLLGRSPDHTGFSQLTAELVRGRSKIEILRGIQTSPEAQERGERLSGLYRRYLVQRLLRSGLSMVRIGRVLRLGRGMVVGPAQPHTPPPFTLPLQTPPPQSPPQIQPIERPVLLDPRPARMEQRLAEQQAALQLITARLGAMQAAQEELARKTLAMLAEQHRLLNEHTKRGAGWAQQAVAREDELVAATALLSDELAALARRLAALELYGAAQLRSEPARLS